MIFETINSDLITAMKAGDKTKVLVLRSLTSECKNEAISVGAKVPSDENCLAAVRRGIKQREKSIEQFNIGGRDDLASAEQYQISVIQNYLPTQLTGDAARQVILQIVSEVGATTKKDLGKVMSALKVLGTVDPKEAMQILNTIL